MNIAPMIRVVSRPVLLAILMFLGSTPDAEAGRVGWIRIKVDGTEMLRGSTYDDGSSPPNLVWRQLATNKLEVMPPRTVTPDESDHLKATLSGDIEIDVRYAAQARVQKLTLVRSDLNSPWFVDAEEMERVAREIGLPVTTRVSAGAAESSIDLAQAVDKSVPVEKEPSEISNLGLILLSVVVSIVALAFVVRMVRQRKPN